MSFNDNLSFALKDVFKRFPELLFLDLLMITCFCLLFFAQAAGVGIAGLSNMLESKKYVENNKVLFADSLDNFAERLDYESLKYGDKFAAVFLDADNVVVVSPNPFAFLKNINFEAVIDGEYNKPIAVLGSNRSESIGDNFKCEMSGTLYSSTLEVVNVLPKDSKILLRSGVVKLDDKKLCVFNMEDFSSLNAEVKFWENIRLADNLNDEEIIKLSNYLSANNYCQFFFPIDQKSLISEYSSSFLGAFVAYLFMFIFLMIILAGIGLFIRELISKSLREYAVHKIIGASLKDIRMRLGLFIILIMTLPFIFMIAIIVDVWFKMGDFNPFIMPVLLLFFAVLVYLNNRGRININSLNKVIRNFSQ